jgi:ATP-dependent HslUV protease ATP-binding subunit HslU
MEEVKGKAAEVVEEKLLDLLVPPLRRTAAGQAPMATVPDDFSKTKEKMRTRLRNGKMDEAFVEIDQQIQAGPVLEIFQGPGMEEMGDNLQDMIGNMMPRRSKRRKVKIKDARNTLLSEETARLVDMSEVANEAIRRVEESGIVFIDELDKVAGRERQHGPEVSREGVQRDLLPIVEGTTVTTRTGPVKTDHILFIAAGAFNVAKPSDLIPEMQGRFPLRVNLDSLRAEDFVRILTEPHNALTKQYRCLLEVDGVQIQFKPKAIRRLAKIAFELNEDSEQIGARRLHTVMEKLLEDISFDAPENLRGKVVIDQAYVDEKLKHLVEDRDLSKYIL